VNKQRCPRWAGPALAVALLSLAAPPPCPAGPVILNYNGRLTYDAGTGNFHSDLTPLSYTDDGGVTLFTGPGATSIDLLVDHSGAFLSSGTGFQLTGTVHAGGMDFSGDLPHGPITAFAADLPGPPTRHFNGSFDITGGALTMLPDFPAGSPSAFILYAEDVTVGTLGDFTHNFASDSVKGPGPAPAPEPAAWVLGLVGAGVVAGWGLYPKRSRRPGRAAPLAA
jgi:hypothetical protein